MVLDDLGSPLVPTKVHLRAAAESAQLQLARPALYPMISLNIVSDLR